MVAGMHRLVQVADEMGEEGQRHQPLSRRYGSVGQQPRGALDLRRNAIAVLARRLEIEWLADVDVLIMPAVGIAEAVAERLDAIRPDAGLLQASPPDIPEFPATGPVAAATATLARVSGRICSQAMRATVSCPYSQ